jgi:hypothetical protein
MAQQTQRRDPEDFVVHIRVWRHPTFASALRVIQQSGDVTWAEVRRVLLSQIAALDKEMADQRAGVAGRNRAERRRLAAEARKRGHGRE